MMHGQANIKEGRTFGQTKKMGGNTPELRFSARECRTIFSLFTVLSLMLRRTQNFQLEAEYLKSPTSLLTQSVTYKARFLSPDCSP